jgi:hypothetical protein
MAQRHPDRMSRILFLYSTGDRHTLKICARLQQLVEAAGQRATREPLASAVKLEP